MHVSSQTHKKHTHLGPQGILLPKIVASDKQKEKCFWNERSMDFQVQTHEDEDETPVKPIALSHLRKKLDIPNVFNWTSAGIRVTNT